MGKTIALEIQGSSNIGLFAYANDEYCVVGKGLSDEHKKSFEKALEVPLKEITIGGSSQVGVYLNGNSKKLLVPSLITEKEKEMIDVDFAIINTKETALGNNLIVNDNYFFYNPEMEASAVKEIEEALELKGEALELEEWEVIGSIVAVTSQGGLVQNDIDDDTKNLLEKKLKVNLERGTLNFGSPIVSGAVVVNKNGMVIGKASAGIEITNADLAFGFLER